MVDDLTKANKRSDLHCDCKLTKDGWVLCKEHKDEKTFNITKQPAEKEAEHKERALAEQADNERLAQGIDPFDRVRIELQVYINNSF